MGEERPARLMAVRRILRSHTIRSQQTLLNILRAEGIAVTQATLSRDLKLLKIGKQPDGEGGYTYTDAREVAGQDKEKPDVPMDGFLSLSFSGNLGLIKTLPGHANGVAYGLDNMGLDEVLGTIAGDDTILVVLREGVSRRKLVKSLASRLPSVEEKLK
jgi:transcriptional regulator of arginine metabolism